MNRRSMQENMMGTRGLILLLGMLVCLTAQESVCQSKLFRRDTPSWAGGAVADASSNVVGTDTALYVEEMIRLAGIDDREGRVLEAIRKIQHLLILEKHIRPLRLLNFNIIVKAANFYSSFDSRYGLEYYKRASALVPLLADLSQSDIFSLYSTRAGVHATLMELDSALYYYDKAIRAAQLDNPVSQGSSYNNLGVHFLKRKEYDTAAVCFEKALGFLKGEYLDIILYCAVQDNMAQIKIREQRYDDALRTFSFNDSIYTTYGVYRKALPNLTQLVKMMHQLGRPGIETIIRRGTVLIRDHLQEMKAQDILLFYRTADAYYADKGKFQESNFYRNIYMRTADSLDLAKSEQLHELTKSLLALQESNYVQELRTRNLEAEKTRIQLKWTQRILLVSVLSAGAILLLLYLYFRKRRQELAMRARNSETELRHKQIEARMVEQELALKKKDLTNIVLHNTQVYDLTQKMIERLEDVSSQKQDLHLHLRNLLQDLRHQNQIGDRAITLQANIESLNEAFYSSLRSRYPGITKAEAELCGYIRINLTSKDISILKNVEVASVKMGKNRLRKRLGLSVDVDLYAFIQNI